MFAAARFRTPWVDDEFAATIQTSRRWLSDNPCPEELLGRHFVEMLGSYAEMTSATVARVMQLRIDIEEHVKALDGWKAQSMNTVAAAPADRESVGRRERREAVRAPVVGRTS
jgi:hypothetical protein